MHMTELTKTERVRLRSLAQKQLEYSKLPVMTERTRLWRAHNNLCGERPMINTETNSFEYELIPPLECKSNEAREIELALLRNMLNHEYIGDDRIISDDYFVAPDTKLKLFDIDIQTVHAKSDGNESLGHRFVVKIDDLAEDLPRLSKSTYYYNREATQARLDFARDAIGDILNVKLAPVNPKFVLSRIVVYLMGMENMCFALIDYPDEFNELLKRMTDDSIEYYHYLETEGLLTLNNGVNYVWPTTHGLCDRLPAPGYSGRVRNADLWLGMDSQETVSTSPATYAEVFFPHYKRVADMFGLLMYGCCEPTDRVWDSMSKFTNLAKLSTSPWCNVNFMGEALRGSGIILHRKVSPNFVGVGKTFNEEGFRAHIRELLLAAVGCRIEFALRDIYTLCGDPGRLRRAVDVIREEISANYKP